MGLEARIWALRLEYELKGGGPRRRNWGQMARILDIEARGSRGWREKVGDELHLKNIRLGSHLGLKKNWPPKVSRVIEGANHH